VVSVRLEAESLPEELYAQVNALDVGKAGVYHTARLFLSG